MKSCPWMEVLVSENFRLPITVKKDNQYFSRNFKKQFIGRIYKILQSNYLSNKRNASI